MSKSSHSFSVDIAAQEGLIEAILLQHIHILQTSFLERDQNPDTAWVRRSVRAYHITYPYLTDKKISGALDRMEERDLIRSKIQNKVSYDRTKSVQLAQKGWSYFRENAFDEKENGKDQKENGFDQTGESLQGSYSSFVDSFVEGERTPPAPNPSTSKEEKKENGLVAPGRADEWPTNCEFCEGNGMKDVGSGPANCLECGGSGVKAETPPSPNSAPPHSPADTCLNCGGSKANDYKTCVGCDGFDNPEYGPRFKVTAIAYPTDLPGVTLVEAAPKLQPLPRVATTLEAETKIMAWITGEGLETVKHRFSIAKQRFDPDNAAAIAAHYCSVYTKNAANKGRLLADPITHFSDGLFSYLKNEESFGRNNVPKEGSPTRNQTPPANFQTSTRY